MAEHFLDKRALSWNIGKLPWWLLLAVSAFVFAAGAAFLCSLFLRSPQAYGDMPPNLRNCVEYYRGVLKSSGLDVVSLGQLLTYCFSEANYQGQANDILISHGNFLNQRFETNILLWMVVAITISGVVLAALQLLGSYKLASLGLSKFSAETNIEYGKGGAIVKSSIIGVVILSISFAFFLIFVLYVYRITPVPGVSTQSPPGRLQLPSAVQH